MPGAVAIVLVLLIFPVIVGISMLAIAFVFGQLLDTDGKVRNADSELVDLNV